MNPEKLEIVGSLKFQDKLLVNGKIIYRGNEARDINTQDHYWIYEFYTKWDKTANLLPKPSYIVKVYVSFKKEIVNGKEIFKFDKHLKGVLIDLQTNTEEEIISLSQ